MRARGWVALLAFLLITSGCLTEGTQKTGGDSRTRLADLAEKEAIAQAQTKPHAVVALIDTGINPYHQVFRDTSPEAYLYPGTYLAGYPPDAVALNLTFDAPDYLAAVKADCEKVWKEVKSGQLYWFPGTKIVGAITHVSPGAQANCALERPATPRILDVNGHGTMVASRAASVEYGACRECKVVAVQGFSVNTVEWSTSNATWIDAQSNSWGPFLPIPAPGGRQSPLPGSTSDFVRVVEKAGRAHLSFWASGNGALTRLGALGHPTIIDPRMTPSIIMVGGHDSGYVNTWPDFPPHVVSDSCNSWAADVRHYNRSADNIGGGTSGASPYAAGGAVRILLEARILLNDTRTGVRGDVVAQGTAPAGVTSGPLADGKLTLSEWKTLVFKTATPRPKRQYEDGSVCEAARSLIYGSTPILWKDVPAQYPEFVHIGYGAVDNESRQLAFDVLRGKPMPDRSRTDQYFAAEAPVRAALHQVYGSIP